MGRLELPRVAPLDSKSSASTSSATLARAATLLRIIDGAGRRIPSLDLGDGATVVAAGAGQKKKARRDAMAPARPGGWEGGYGIVLLAVPDNALSTPDEFNADAAKK